MMAPAARAPAPGATSLDRAARRIAALDVLRGVGVLGMLAVHIQLFAFPSLARWNPTAYGEFAGLNWWVWLATAVVADGKFITIFAMLFGVSIVMLAGRDVRDGRPPWRVHLRRMVVLLVIGLAHAYLLWYGDMLVSLALGGALVFLGWRASPAWLLALGAAALVTASGLSWWLTWSTVQADPAALAVWRAQWTPRPELIALELLQYRGGWGEQMAHRVPTVWETHTWYFATHLLWKVAGLMLIGMALLKLGVLTAARSTGFYVGQAVGGLGLGLLLVSVGLRHSIATRWDLLQFVLVSQPLHYWGDILVAVGMVAVVMLLCRHGWLLRPVAAVGRMALTNYLSQTVACTTMFYGHGLGLFGRIDRTGQLAIVVGIWIFQLTASSVWLRYVSVGPVEQLVRGLVFGGRSRWRRHSAGMEPSPAAGTVPLSR